MKKAPLSEGQIEAVYRDIEQGNDRLFNILTVDQRDWFIQLFTRLAEGDEAMLEALYAQDYDHIPVTPEVFFTEPDYLGHMGKDLYKAWWPHVLNICDPHKNVSEVIFTGGIGFGKSWVANAIITPYKIYWLSTLKKPARYFGLADNSKIIIGVYAITKEHVEEIGFFDLRNQAIDNSPYFRYVFPRMPNDGNTIIFGKNIRVLLGSKELHAIGHNLFAISLDELNFLNQGAATARKAHNLVTAVSRRTESRFRTESGVVAGFVILISSKRTETDYLEDRIRKVRKLPGVYIVDAPFWEFDEKTIYCGKRMHVQLGGDFHDSKLLDDVLFDEEGFTILGVEERRRADEGAEVIEVPAEHYKAFIEDLDGSIRDIAGRSTRGFTPFFGSKHVIIDSIDASLPLGFDAERIAIYIKGSHQITDGFNVNRLCRVELSRWTPMRHPNAPRYIHIDLAKNRDAAGFAMIHPAGHYITTESDEEGGVIEQDGVPIITVVKDIEVDLAVAFVAGPHGEEIDFQKIRNFVIFLRNIGFWIRKVTYDSWECLVEGTRVNTDRGLLPLEEVRVGDLVESRSGPRAVLKIFKYENAPTVFVETKDGDVLGGTGKHRIEALERWKWSGGCRRPVWGWKRLGSLKPGDVVRMRETPVTVDGQDQLLVGKKEEFGWRRGNGKVSAIDGWTLPSRIYPEFAGWLGAVWGDGQVKDDGVRVSANRAEIEDLKKVFSRLFHVSFDHHGEGDRLYVEVSARWLTRFMRYNGLIKPFIPEKILRSSRASKAAFLQHLFSTDGSVGEDDGGVTFSTEHKKLAQQARLLLLTDFGIQSLLHARVRDTNFKEGSEEYIVCVRGSRRLFLEKIGFCYRKKQALLERHKDVKGRFIFSRVKSVSNGSCGTVRDLHVEGDHSYIANGFVSHNSVDSIQLLRGAKFEADVQSVDRTAVPYKALRRVMAERRFRSPPNELFREELTGLEHDVEADKVNHREGESKDVADGVCGSTYGCLIDKIKPGDVPPEKRGSASPVRASKYDKYLDQIKRIGI